MQANKPAAVKPERRQLIAALTLTPALSLLGACASLSGEPPRVTLVNLQSLPGQGLEWRMQARLRVQNPSGREIRYEGVTVDVELRGQSFASGVAPVVGTIPAFSEAVIEVPLSVSGLGMLRQMLDLFRELSREPKPGAKAPTLPYALRGRLGGFGGPRFESSGVVELPDIAANRPADPPPKDTAPK